MGLRKTMTLRMIAGLETPTSGSIRLGGEEMSGRLPRERDVGFLFQFHALYPHLTVFDNIAFPLESAKLREELRVELVVLRRQLAIPMLYVTHDQAEALSMGDRLAVLSRGRAVQTGTAWQVYRHPRRRRSPCSSGSRR